MSTLDLAVIGNCNIAALVDQRANLVWMCFPRLDGDPVFCSLLDGNAGQERAGIVQHRTARSQLM